MCCHVNHQHVTCPLSEQQKGDDTAPLAVSYEPKFEAILSKGDPERDFIVSVSVSIMDSMLLTSSMQFFLRVRMF